MIVKTTAVFTNREILQILSDYYNKEKGTNHSFEFANRECVGTEIPIQITKWDKDEKTH